MAPIVVDTDVGSDVDDALAIALAIRHPEIDLRAVTTVSSQPEVRAGLAARLLAIGGADDVEVAVGRSAPGDERNVIGAEHLDLLGGDDGSPPRPDAVAVLGAVTPGTRIVTIGQQTNVAAAVAAVPSLPGTIARLTVMGGAFAAVHTADGRVHGPERDWNLVLDPAGAVASLSSEWRRRFVPIDITFGAALTRAHVDRLRGGDELCRVLAALVEGWRSRTLGAGGASAPDDLAAFLHDPLAVACAVECAFVRVERMPVTVVLDGRGHARTVVDELEGRDAEVVRALDASGFADWLVDTLLSS